MNKNDWNPELYLKFDKERIQPSIDLVSRIDFDKPEKIIDIGCGPGNSTQILVQRWPDSKITGVDNSPAMIEKAKHDFPNQEWRILDAGNDKIDEKFDILFSNATIQWIPNHADLLRRFYNLLSDKGLIAIQLPLFWDMPLGKSIVRIAENNRWSDQTKGVTELFTIHNSSFYYEQLSELYHLIEIWESNYFHILNSHMSILEMIRSTGLRPYLNKIKKNTDKIDFEAAVLQEIEKDYPLQKNGNVLFPFKRLFFIAKK
ncbi:MAG: methyltransferase domain-containing protein [Bacteroidales bacterium]|nr:methyltransferase domain-containing protein [Bacteroidales bacterium]